MRDYADVLQLVILMNLENLNAEMIKEGISQNVRLERLNNVAKCQFQILRDSRGVNKIKKMEE